MSVELGPRTAGRGFGVRERLGGRELAFVGLGVSLLIRTLPRKTS